MTNQIENQIQNVYYLSLPLNLAADDGSNNTEKGKSMTGTVYSGAVMYDAWGDPFIVDLATTEVVEGMPILYEHNRTEIIGVVDSYSKTSQFDVSGELFTDIDETARVIDEKSQRGVKYQMSIGLFDTKRDFINSGLVTVNGQTFDHPIMVLRDGIIRESSVVVLGYDDDTNAEFFSESKKGKKMTKQTESIEDMDLATQVKTLSAQLELSKSLVSQRDTELKEAKEIIKTLQMTARKAKVQELFTALGKEYTDDSAAQYFAMDDTVFDAVTSDFLAAKPGAPDNVYQGMDFGKPDDSGGQQSSQTLINRADIFSARKPGA